MLAKGELLWYGNLSWDVDEDSMESIDVPSLPIGDEEQFLVSVRNGSAVVDLTVFVGMLTKAYPASSSPRGSVAIVYTDSTGDTFQVSGTHGLVVGDAVVFSGDGGGVTPGDVYYVVSVDGEAFQVSTTRGGVAFDVDADSETNEVSIADEFFELSNFDVLKFAAGSSIAPVAGLTSKVFTGFGHYGGRFSVAKSAATAAAFNCYIEIRRA
jgi:hypothetical protein